MNQEVEVNEQTYVCSVVFLDIVQFSQQSNKVQSAWRVELSAMLDKGLEGMNPDHRVIVDTGDGAAIAFLYHPEEALSFTCYIHAALPALISFSLRVGAHLGPLRLVRGMNGHPNIVGDGINAAQRVMGFAGINEVLVSRAFHEAVIWLSSGNSDLFSPYGMQADKHGRQHNLFMMGPEVTQATFETDATARYSVAVNHLVKKPLSQYVKVILAVVLTIVTGVGLWSNLWNRSSQQAQLSTASPVELSTPDSTKTVSPPQLHKPAVAPAQLKISEPSVKKPHKIAPITIQKKTVPKKENLTATVGSGNVEKKIEGIPFVSDDCPECTCSDLMTQLSLGERLDDKKRRFMDEKCRK